MKVLFDFKCNDCGKVQERFVDNSIQKLTCMYCDGEAVKQLSATRCKLESVTGAFPGAYHKWTKEREERGRKSALKAHEESIS